MACVLIIGDDLTGSNATGVLYAKAGRRVVTVSSVGLAAAMRNDVDVLVVDTESRHLPPNVAASRVRTVVAAAAQWGVQVVKRVDTTLRGNVGAEVEAALVALRAAHPEQRQVALLVPAFPASGRITVGGMQLVDGLPIQRSWAALDPFTPVDRCGVAAIIAEQSTLTSTTIDLDSVGPGLASRLAQAAGRADIVIVDAISDDDVATIAQAAHAVTGVGWLIVDSGPFGAAFAPAAPQAATQTDVPLTLVIAGSLTDQTVRQLDRLTQALDAQLVTINPLAVDADEVVAQLTGLAARGASVVGVRTCALTHLPDAVEAQQALHLLGEVTRRAAAALRPAGIYATGGDVAITVISVLGGDGFAVIDEVLPLAVAGRIVGGPHDGVALVTKGGLIGEDDAALVCVTRLQQLERETGTMLMHQVGAVRGPTTGTATKG